MCRLIMVLLVCFMPSLALGATYYVSTSGSGSTCSLGSPCGTIATGVAKLFAGDTLYLRGGTYVEGINADAQTVRSGTSWSNVITIASYPGETATLRPNGGGGVIILNSYNSPYDLQYIIFDRLVLDGFNTYNTLALNGSRSEGAPHITHHVRFQNGEIMNASRSFPPCTTDHYGINVSLDGEFNEVINSKIHNCACSYGFYVAGEDNLIDGNEIYDNAGYGIQMYRSSGSANRHTARNNRIYGNGFPRQVGAINMNNGTSDKVYNNLIYGNNAGIEVGFNGASPNMQVYNNTIYNNTGPGIQLGVSSQGATISNNIMYQNGGTIVDYGSTGTTNSNNLTTNPLFVNAAGADFHLQSGSPAIDTGTNLSSIFTTDFAGAARGTLWEIGAYVFGGAVTPPSVALSASPTSRTFAQVTTATWTVTAGTPSPVDYVALFLVGDSPANKVWVDGAGILAWAYTNGVSSGTLPITVPNLAPGASANYEFRYCVNDSTSCIATSQTIVVTGPVITAPNIVLAQSGLSVSSAPAGCDSQETSASPDFCSNIRDSDPATLWHTQWSSAPPGQPHQIIINLGASYPVSGWVYLPRQDGVANGTIVGWSLYVSTDGTTWGAALTSGTFASNATEKVTIAGGTQVGNFVRITTSSALTGNFPSTDTSGAWTSAAEIYVLINPGAGSYTITQARYRWFAADGGLLPGCGENQVCGAAPGETRQLRVKVTATLANPPLLSLQLYCRVNASAFAVVPINGSPGVNVCMGLGTGFVSGQATNRALTLDQAAFLPGAYVSVTPTVQSIDLSQNSETEYVWFIATPSGLSSGTTVDCKVVLSDGSVLQAYTVNPSEVLQNAQLRLGGTSIGGVTFR